MNNAIADSDHISLHEVETAVVYDAAGEKLGYIDDVVFDKHTGLVRYAVLGIAGAFLDTGTDRYPLPWSMIKYDAAKEGYVFPLEKAKLEKAPRYNEATLPAFTADYDQFVNAYYGATL